MIDESSKGACTRKHGDVKRKAISQQENVELYVTYT